MRALVIAATGMNAQNQNLEVIANNIANINTTAFKRSRAEFTDLLYQAERIQGVANRGANSVVPEGAQIGLGVRTAAIRPLEIQGSMTSTNNQLDIAISGRGWFQVQSPSGETLYTRAGSLSTNAQGQIVNTDGYPIMPNMVVPNNTTAITVSETGIVSATIGGQTDPQQIGQLTLATFVNEPGLMALGSNLFQPTAASGQAVTGVPGDPGIGKIKQGYLEASNVDPVSEIATMIQAQRAYEMNSKVLEAASSMAGTIANLRTS